MKFVYKKNNKGPARTCFRGGFALLFSVLISSLLLTIGLSIFSIALKELAISTATRQSIHAFYAADSGRECVKYWDTKRGKIPTLINGQIGGDITCAGKTIDLENSDYVITEPISTNIPSGGGIIPIDAGDSEGPNFYVTINKYKENNDPTTRIQTTIVSTGHDTSGGDRVERAIEQNY